MKFVELYLLLDTSQAYIFIVAQHLGFQENVTMKLATHYVKSVPM